MVAICYHGLHGLTAKGDDGTLLTMDLRAILDRYLALAGGFGAPVALEQFAGSREELERAFAILDEDYLISRYFHFTTQPGAAVFRINGFDHTHVAIDGEIQSVL